ncbi:MAG: phenylacetate--CoA ligase family protein [Burkholderiaceae bacterium]
MSTIAWEAGPAGSHLDGRESRDPEAREADLMQRLPGSIARAKTASGFAKLLADVDATSITSRAALAALPITRKSDLKAMQEASPPWGGLAATDTSNLSRLFMSPGPTFDPEGRGDDWWRFARPLWSAGLRPGRIVHNAFSYHFTPAAFMVEGGAKKIGCPVIPAGVGNTDMQLQAIAGLKPAFYAGTPSFLKLIIEKAIENGADISSIEHALVSAEPLPATLRTWLIEHGMKSVLQLYGTADLGCVAYETQTDGIVHPGFVVDEDVLVEIVRPGTGEPLPDGEVGEIVVTNFNHDYPLVRFATGDLSAVLAASLSTASPCGRTNRRIAGWMGRADQTTKVRGMFVHPAQIAAIVKRHPEVARARMVVSGAIGDDRMTLLCELKDDAPASDEASDAARNAAIVASIRDVTRLRGDVAFTAPGQLPNDGKVIEDARKHD